MGAIGAGIGADIGIAAADDMFSNIWNWAGMKQDKWYYDDMKKREDSRYQRMMADLRAAGMNPLLAFGKQAGGVAQAPKTSAKHTSTAPVNVAAKITAAKQLELSERDVSSRELVAAANSALANEQANKAIAEEEEIRARTPVYAKDISKKEQDVIESKQRVILSQTQVKKLESEIGNVKMQRLLIKAQVKLTDQQKKYSEQQQKHLILQSLYQTYMNLKAKADASVKGKTWVRWVDFIIQSGKGVPLPPLHMQLLK